MARAPKIKPIEGTFTPKPDGLVEVRIIHDGTVFLDGGRTIGWQESARVSPELADMLVEKGLAKHA